MKSPSPQNSQAQFEDDLELGLLSTACSLLRKISLLVTLSLLLLFVLRLFCNICGYDSFSIINLCTPVLTSLVSFLIYRLEIKQVWQYNVITCMYRLAFNLIIFESFIRLSGSKMLTMMAMLKSQFIFEELQVFSNTIKMGQTLVTHIYVLWRISRIYDQPIQGLDSFQLLQNMFVMYIQVYITDELQKYLKDKIKSIVTLEQRWFAILQKLNTGVAILTAKDCALQFYNEALLNILHLQKPNVSESLMSTTLIKKSGGERLELTIQQFISECLIAFSAQDGCQESTKMQFKVKTSNATVQIEAQKYKDYTGDDVILFLVTDITSTVNLTKSRNLQRMKTIYFCSVAHDLKTPINSIMATNQSLKLRHQQDSMSQRLLDINFSSCQFLLRIIEDITDLSRIELKQFQIENRWFQLKEVCDEVMQVMQIPIQLKNIKLIINHQKFSENYSEIFCDPKRIKQILFNLIGNALKFTFKGYISVEIDTIDERPVGMNEDLLLNLDEEAKEEEVKVMEVEPDNDSLEEVTNVVLQFRVIDTGVGIKEQHMNQLFKLFGKIHDEGDINKQGIGLGLTICKKLTELMGGQIKVESQYGSGSTFTFTLKCKARRNMDFIYTNHSMSFNLDSKLSDDLFEVRDLARIKPRFFY